MSASNHYAAGFALGLIFRFTPKHVRERRALALDDWGWNREWQQNLAGENPNDPMSERQVAEAMAWGDGFRKAAGIGKRNP